MLKVVQGGEESGGGSAGFRSLIDEIVRDGAWKMPAAACAPDPRGRRRRAGLLESAARPFRRQEFRGPGPTRRLRHESLNTRTTRPLAHVAVRCL